MTTSRWVRTTPVGTKSARITRSCFWLCPTCISRSSDEAIVLEAVIAGRHLGAWSGLPPTGLRVEFPLCAVFSFDEADRLATEKIYYDRATVLRQLGVFHEPASIMGRINVFLMHPLTIARILVRMILRRS